MDFDKRKAVLMLCQWLIENKYCDIAKLMKEAPRDKFDTLPNEEKIDVMVSALDIRPLLKEMGLADYNKTSGSIPKELFRWTR